MSGARHKFACSNSIIDASCLIIVLMEPRKLRIKLIARHCNYQDILSLAEYSCDKHHVCAFSRRPQIQLFDEDLSGRQTVYSTLQSSPTPPVLQSVQYYHFQGNWKQVTPSPFVLTSEHPIFVMICDFVAFFSRFTNFKLTRC